VAASFGGGCFVGGAISGEGDEAAAGLAVATGPDGWVNTKAAVEALGGVARFVPSGSTVAINANTAFKHRGSIVAPDVLLAVLELCAEAGASEVWLLKEAKEGFWERCDRAKKRQAIIDTARASERDYQVVKIDRGLALTEAHVDRHWLTADVVLNVTIAKHHKGCDYTGALKNTMGVCPHDPTCRFFHVGSQPDSKDWYPDMAHLSQCIADLNTIRNPDLTILDAGEILITNGPFGPGKLAQPGVVAAGTDMVALDAFGVRYLDLEPAAVPMIARAEAHGLGSSDLKAVGVRDIT
jgi:uncharacterized protein (DUF362 family)